MVFFCPSCHRPLHNRRRVVCDFCGKPIPESMRVSEQKREFLKKIREDEEKKHREFMEGDWPQARHDG